MKLRDLVDADPEFEGALRDAVQNELQHARMQLANSVLHRFGLFGGSGHVMPVASCLHRVVELRDFMKCPVGTDVG